jgi:Nif-specific regulatory protein
MLPALFAVAGPLAGTTISLETQELAIGRDETNGVTLAEDAVSARHCIVSRRGSAIAIRDLDPTNPTFVNGLPANERQLEAGDRIQIGTSVFVMGVAAPLESASVHIDDRASSGTSIVMRREDVFAEHADAIDRTRALSDRSALIRIASALGAVHGLVGLQRPLLELIAEVVPVDRGAFVLNGTGGTSTRSAVAWERGGKSPRTVHVSRPVLDRVLRDVVGVLEREDPSREATPPRSVLAAPLVAFDRVVGAIVLENDRRDEPFDEGHLRLLMAIAASAATALQYARQIEWLEDENRRLQATLDSEYNLVGDTPAMRQVCELISLIAPSDSTLLITGESGTGKEVVAHAIHRNSRRARAPFVAINCAAITETLLESELFGHEKGAFTGAVSLKKGKLESAEGGTVFLDEVSELSAALQAKLLRVLQEREFERVGGTRLIRVDFRLIAATNRNLQEAIDAGSFRSDLFYRLNVVSVVMPALRERRADIPMLASYFLRRAAEKADRRVAGFSANALTALTAYDWPGNVRELENAIERAVVMGSDAIVDIDDLPEGIIEAIAYTAPSAAGGRNPVLRFHDGVKEAKKDLILRAMAQAGGNHAVAAKLLGLQTNYLHRLMMALQLQTPDGTEKDTRDQISPRLMS